MVAIHHKVGIPELIELDRRQVFCTVESPVYALPLVPHTRPRGQEGPVEVSPPPHAADDLLYLYDPPPSVEAIVSHQRLSSSYLIEGAQPVRGVPPSNTSH